MEENTITQVFRRGNAGEWVKMSETTPQAPEVPLLLTKKYLCDRFGFLMPSGTRNYPGLYRKVLTPSVLDKLGVDAEVVRQKSFKTFDREQSILLTKILNL